MFGEGVLPNHNEAASSWLPCCEQQPPGMRAAAWGRAAAWNTPGQVLLDLGVAAGNVRARVQPALLLRSQQPSAAPRAGVPWLGT